MEFLKVNEIVRWVNGSTMLPVPKMCNGYLAINEGDTLFTVNDFPLNPNPNWALNGLAGESTGLALNLGEIYEGNNGVLKIVVSTVPGTNPKLIIVFKFYLPV